MAESTLAITKSELETHLGDYMGWGPSRAEWDEETQGRGDRMLRVAQRWAYYPRIVPGYTESYTWTFLEAVREFTLDSGARTLALPADFKHFVGPLVVTTAGKVVAPLRLSAETRVDWQREPSRTGQPYLFELESFTPPGPEVGQRWRLHVFPTADQAYTLQGKVSLNPEALADSRPFPYGGPQHAEMFRAALLAAAEVHLRGEQNGPEMQNFMAELAASISRDRKARPQLLGYTGDRSDEYSGWWARTRAEWPLATVNGSIPE